MRSVTGGSILNETLRFYLHFIRSGTEFCDNEFYAFYFSAYFLSLKVLDTVKKYKHFWSIDDVFLFFITRVRVRTELLPRHDCTNLQKKSIFLAKFIAKMLLN